MNVIYALSHRVEKMLLIFGCLHMQSNQIVIKIVLESSPQ